jgi:hypothetical protein
LKLRQVLTAVLLLLALMSSTVQFVAADEGNLKGDIKINSGNR